MQDLYFPQLHIVDSQSPWHGHMVQLRVSGGQVVSIEDASAESQYSSLSDIHWSPAWIDHNADFGFPGFEYRENLSTGRQAALAGGFGQCILHPFRQPQVDQKATIPAISEDIVPLQVHFSAALFREHLANSLSELEELAAAGVKAFFASPQFTPRLQLLQTAFLYASHLQVPIVVPALLEDLAFGSLIDDSPWAINLGMPGSPTLAEDAAIYTLTRLAQWHKVNLHFSHVSSPRALQLIQQANNEGASHTADIAIHHLVHSTEQLSAFDSNYLFTPPLRSESDRQQLVAAALEYPFVWITPMHRPLSTDEKKVELYYALPGVISYQTFYPTLLSIYGAAAAHTLLEKATQLASKTFHCPTMSLQVGMPFSGTLFSPSTTWLFSSANNFSRSSNSPFLDQSLTGAALAVFYQSIGHCNPIFQSTFLSAFSQ